MVSSSLPVAGRGSPDAGRGSPDAGRGSQELRQSPAGEKELNDDGLYPFIFRFLSQKGLVRSARALKKEVGAEKCITSDFLPSTALLEILNRYRNVDLVDDVGDDTDDEEVQILNGCQSLNQVVAATDFIVVGEENRGDDRGGVELHSVGSKQEVADKTFQNSEIIVLEGHKAEVFACAWNAIGSHLASGCRDGTCKIWKVGRETKVKPSCVYELKHYRNGNDGKLETVSAIAWNHNGTLLATGYDDGLVEVWKVDGSLTGSLMKHRKSITSLKWNDDDFIITGSKDKTAIIWDVNSLVPIQTFALHKGPVLDVAWKDNYSFATSSADSTINICKKGQIQPVKTFIGHKGPVNGIVWDPTSTLLASCALDGVIKVWGMEKSTCLYSFGAPGVYEVGWGPTPRASGPILVSTSFDTTMLWDLNSESSIFMDHENRGSICNVSLSPNGRYVASGCSDGVLFVWEAEKGAVILQYQDAKITIFAMFVGMLMGPELQ